MSKSKRQSLIVIGFGLIIISGIILYYALSVPQLSVDTYQTTSDTLSSFSSQNTVSYSLNEGSADDENGMQFSSQSSYDAAVELNYPLNLNTCTAEELMTIKGIGEVKAVSIIEYREYLGGYTSVDQIKNIKGIGDAVYAKISPYLTV